ncbi:MULTISPECIES: hypothetical protein [unclassified Pseudomonas]|uniref:hypothetical protein n=1 Tax=unclassified Pseudomonas TaxID=196821 RepID=UPI0004DAE762|nr:MULTISPECIES: hypothetical protein [unclassified Pseudomonas]KES24211.1 hypothetical protein FG99_10610 [Pseudomonas sp. AAC]OHR99678.1 hypothetical protein HMPREF3289_16290 [Pseudomonas sp. HMSC75E02]
MKRFFLRHPGLFRLRLGELLGFLLSQRFFFLRDPLAQLGLGVMNQPDLNLGLCTVEAFGRMCVLPDEVVAEWIGAGVLLSRGIAGICLVDLRRLFAAQLRGWESVSACEK